MLLLLGEGGENVKASHRVNVLGFLLHWCVALV